MAMTVEELIEELLDFGPNNKILIRHTDTDCGGAEVLTDPANATIDWCDNESCVVIDIGVGGG